MPIINAEYVDKLRGPSELPHHWALRKAFLLTHLDSFPADRLVSLSHIFVNTECMGLVYNDDIMKIIKELGSAVLRPVEESMPVSETSNSAYNNTRSRYHQNRPIYQESYQARSGYRRNPPISPQIYDDSYDYTLLPRDCYHDFNRETNPYAGIGHQQYQPRRLDDYSPRSYGQFQPRRPEEHSPRGYGQFQPRLDNYSPRSYGQFPSRQPEEHSSAGHGQFQPRRQFTRTQAPRFFERGDRFR